MNNKRQIICLMVIFMIALSSLLFSQAAEDVKNEPIVGTMHRVSITGFPEIPRRTPNPVPGDTGNEEPITHIKTKNLWVMETEVSQQMWYDLMELQPTLPGINFGFSGPANPVENITWYDAVLFANLLSQQNGLNRCYYADAGFTVSIDATNYTAGIVYCNFNADGYRLPTESEWAYVARVGSIDTFPSDETVSNPMCLYSCIPGDLPSLEDTAWYCANSEGATHPVGSRVPNALNLMDLQGNVSEWCWDWWGIYPGGIRVDYKGPVSGVSRVVRGGSWYDPPALLDPDSRYAVEPDLYFNTVGLRLLKAPNIEMRAPLGGETWYTGKLYTIEWFTGSLSGAVNIELSSEEFGYTIIATPQAEALKYNWTIPNDQPLGSDYKIRIYQGEYECSSGYFTITRQYTVNFEAGIGGSVEGVTPQEVEHGGSCTEVTAVADSCYRFVNWTGTGGFVTSTDNPLTVTNVTSDMTITANFEKIPYTVTFEAGPGGTLTGDTPQVVDCGGNCTPVTAVPDSCYRFVNWTGTGSFVTSTENPLTVTNVQSDMTITANFEKIQYTVTFAAGPGGTLTGDTPQVVDCGEDCTPVTAVPDSCYRFVNWTGTGGFVTTIDNPIAVAGVQSDMTITANFEKIHYTVNFAGTVTGDNPQEVECGGDCTPVTAVPNSCYRFVNWTGTGGFVPTTANPLTVTNVQSDMTITANFEKIQYTVTFAAGPNGTVTGDTPQVVDCGGNCTAVTAVPNSCYRFVNWTGTNGFVTTTANPLTVTNVQSDMTITANFEKIQYTVTFEAGPNGTVTGDTPQVVDCGGNCTAVTAVPDSCYRFVNWTGTNGFVTTTENPLTVTNVTGDMTITANFEINTYTVTFVAGANGTLIGTTPQAVNCGGNCTAVAAVPNSCYRFVNWTGTNGFVATTDNPLTVTNVTGDMTITANFEINTYTVTFVAGANGTLIGTTPQTVNCGNNCTAVAAVPNSCYRFVNWTRTGGFVATTDNPLTVTNVTTDMTITANFEKIQYTVTFAAGPNGTVTGDTPQVVDCGGNCTAVTAVPNAGYRFVNWTGTGGFVTTNANPLTVTNVTSNMTITANFEIIPCTVTFVAGANGTLSGTTPQVVNYGSDCTAVTAVPNSCYRFVNWTGTNGFVATTDNPLTVTNVTTDMTITANFEIIHYTVAFEAGPNGTATGDTPQVVECGGNCTEVTAVPNSCYRFVNWTGAGGFVTTTENPLTVTNVQSDMTITANFEKIQYTVTFEAGTGGTATGDTPQVVECGGNCTAVTAVPDSCYRFVNWTGTTGFVPTTENPLPVINVQSDMTITANFEKIQYTVTFEAGPNGTLAGNTSQVVECGSDCTAVTAVPDSCYRFVNWTGTNGFVAATANPLTVTDVQSDMTITANFEKIHYTVTFEAGPNGTVTGDTSQVVECGSDCTPVMAMPNSHYYLVDWTGTGGFVTSEVNPLTVTNVQSDMTITANFSILKYNVTFVVSAAGSHDGRPGGTLTGNVSQIIDHGSDCTAVSAAPVTGYRFVNWTGDGTFTPTTNNPLTVTNVTTNMTITANFEIDTHTVGFTAGSGGTLTGLTPQVIGYGNNCTTVTAVPNANYSFVNWTGTGGFVTTTSNPLTVRNVTCDMALTANFAPAKYVVNFKAGSGGAITGDTPQNVEHGSNCSAVTAVPGDGYHLHNWTDQDNNILSTDAIFSLTNVTRNMNVRANFHINTYTVTFVAGPNGTVTGTTPQTVNHGGNCTALTAVPNENYHFVNWTGTNGFITTTAIPLIVMNVTDDMTITANFAINTHTVTFEHGSGGGLSGTVSQMIPHGGDCTQVEAVPDSGYRFVNWTGTGSTANPLTVTNVTGDMVITANFEINTYTITFVAGANGEVSGTTPQTVDYGSNCMEVSAIPNTGYHFVNWTGTGGFNSTTNPLTVANVTGDMTITANFAINTYTVTFEHGSGGGLSGTVSQVIPHGGDCTAVEAVPDSGYRFVNWAGTGSTANPLTVTNVTGNMTITANFEINTYTVTFVAGANGTLSDTSPQTVDYGSNCTAVTAIPNANYHFVNWTGANGFNSTANPLTVTNVTSDMTITANFATDTYTVNFAAENGGTLTGLLTQTVIRGGSCSSVTANSNTGYDFTEWTDQEGRSYSDNPLTVINVTKNMVITANFTKKTYTVTFLAGANGILTGGSPQIQTLIPYGGSCTAVTAVPNTNYYFANWTGGGSSSFFSTDNPLTVTNVTQNMTITANFANNGYTVYFVEGNGGTISGVKTQIVKKGGSCLPVTAVANTGYHFVNWTGTGGFETTTSNPLTVAPVNSDMAITANFAINQYTVTFQAGANGEISGATSQTVEYGGSCSEVTANANTGYIFSNWTGTGGFVTTKTSKVTVTNVTGNMLITANFTASTYKVTFQAVIDGVEAGRFGGSINGYTTQTIVHGQNCSAVTAVPAGNYRFDKWTLNGALYSYANPLTVTNVTAPMEIKANFIFGNFTLYFIPGANGTLTGTITQTLNYGETSTAVTAVPNTGYRFVSWTDAGGFFSGQNPLTVENVTRTMTLTANFAVKTPIVYISYPVNNSIVSGTVTIQAHTDGDIAVTKVDFFIDNILIGSSSTFPFTYPWNTITYTNNTHQIKAKAYYGAGQTETSQNITVTVRN